METDRQTDRQTDRHLNIKSSDGAKNSIIKLKHERGKCKCISSAKAVYLKYRSHTKYRIYIKYGPHFFTLFTFHILIRRSIPR